MAIPPARKARVLPALPAVERAPLLSHTVQDAIRAAILANRLQPGDPLPSEAELARQTGVSRSSVREAIKALASLGIVETRRGSGAFVRAFSFDPLLQNLSYGLLVDLRELGELLEIRRVLETGMIEQAMRDMPPELLAALRAVIEHMHVRAERGEGFVEEDRRFHQLLFEGLGNGMLLKLLDVFWLTFRKASEHADIRDADPLRTYRDHAAILAAVEAHQGADARDALNRHYAGLGERLLRAQQRLQQEREDRLDERATTATRV